MAKELTKAEIRKAALIILKSIGFDPWVNNNIAVRGRKFIGRYGVADIIGFGVKSHVAGLFMGAEIKTQSDFLSTYQKEFLISLNKSGGVGYIFEDDKKGGVRYYLYLNDKS